MRAPFLDAQTGIAMNNCHLWLSRFMRREPKTPQYVYTYPPRRWRKRKRIPHVETEEEDTTHVGDEGWKRQVNFYALKLSERKNNKKKLIV